MSSTERYESIIDVQYLGQRDIDAYIKDLERLGAITESVASRLRAAVSGGLGGNSDDIGKSLGVGAARMLDYDRGAQRALATTKALTAQTSKLADEMRRLDALVGKIQGGGGYRPGAAAGGGGQELTPAVGREVRRQLYAALQANAVNQRIATQGGFPSRAIGSGPQPLALNAGSGIDQAAIKFEAALERRLARQALRGNEATGFTYGAGGRVTGVQFEQSSQKAAAEFASVTEKLVSLRAQIVDAQVAFQSSKRNISAAGRQAEEMNRDILQARISTAEILSRAGQNQNDALDELPVGNRLLYQHGLANRGTLSEIGSPEKRGWLVGENGDPLKEYKDLLKRLSEGIPVPGLVNRAGILSENAGRATEVSQTVADTLESRRYQLAQANAGAAGPIALGASERAQSELLQIEQRRATVARTLLEVEQRRAAIETALNARSESLAGVGRQLGAAREPLAQPVSTIAEAAQRVFALGPGPSGRVFALGAGGQPGLPFGPGGTGVGGGSGGSGGSGGGLGGSSSAGGSTPAPDWVQNLINELRGLGQASTASPVEKAQAGLLAAQRRMEDVIAKGDLGVGTKGGYGTDEARGAAFATAYKAGETAQDKLNLEIGRETQAREAAAQAYVNAVNEAAAAERTAAAASRAGSSTGVAQAHGDQSLFGSGGLFGNGSAATAAQLAKARAAASAGSGGGFLGNAAADFSKGFKGEGGSKSYAEQVGQTFKFSVLYGSAYKILSGFTATLAATVQEGIEFQQAVTELKLATQAGAARTDQQLTAFANTLGDQAVQAGAAPSQGVLVGARAIGLYGATNSSIEDQNAVARLAAREVSRVALSSGQQPADIQTNIAAITNAFDTGSQGIVRVADLDAYVAQKFGITPGQTITAVSESATAARAAGFTQEQTTSIAGDLIARTGQTPEAIAGYMAQIFSRAGEGSLTALTGKYGIDPNEDLAHQISDLAKIYKERPDQRDDISAVFGRGKVQNAAIALLQDYGQVQTTAANAVTGATGASDKAFEERLSNLGGQLSLFYADLKELANQLGQSGLLTGLGVVVKVVDELAKAGSGLLTVWNLLPGTIKGTIASLLLLAAAARTGVGSSALSGLAGFSVFRSAGGAYGPSGAVIPAGQAAVVTRSGETAALGAGGAGLAAKSLLSTAAIGAVIGGVIVDGLVTNANRRLNDVQSNAAYNLTNGLSANSTVDQLRARADALDTTGKEARDASNGVFAHVPDLGAKSAAARDNAAQLEAEAVRLRAVADQRANASAAASVGNAGFVQSFDSQGLTDSLGQITAAGGTAKDRLGALADSILGTANAADRAAKSFDANLFAGDNAQAIYTAIAKSSHYQVTDTGAADVAKGIVGAVSPFYSAPKQTDYKDILPEELAKHLSQTDVQGRLQNALAGTHSLKGLTAGKANSIANYVVGDTAQKVYGSNSAFSADDIEQARQQMIAAVSKELLDQAESIKNIVSGTIHLSDTELTAVVNQTTQDYAEIIQNLPQTDLNGRSATLKAEIRRIRAYIRKSTNGATPAVAQQLRQVEIALAENQVARLDALRKVAQQNADGAGQIRTVGQGFFRREANAALRGGDQDGLVKLVQTAGAYGKTYVLKAVSEAIAAAKAYAASQADLAAISPSFAGRPGGDPDLARPDANSADPKSAAGKIKRLQQIRDAIIQSIHGDIKTDPFTTGSDVPSIASAETSAERAAALATANATRSESPIAAARAQILTARAAMAKATKGTLAYYQALDQLYAAQNALTDAVLAYKANRYLLSIDQTNPLEQAKAALLAAQQKLRSDKGKGGDVRAADLVALQNAQTNVEATKFSQRLSAVQTAEQLQRISHGAYIRYLDNEKARLEAIGHRTYQQQQQLDQIDGLLKDASKELQGQFNFGNIHLPTPYQVRRYIEQASGSQATRALGTAVHSPGSTTTIYIDGADTAKVRRIVEDVTGSKARTTTAAPRRR